MTARLLKTFKVYEDEIAMLLWTVVLLFIIRSCGTVLNNFAETAFLKRYGVEYLPVVNMINAVITFIITGFITAFAARTAATNLLSWIFVLCGISVTIIRLMIPLGVEFIYPLLFMMKSQFEMIQALMFWNLANDLYNNRQSKRLFPLLTAGGVVGMILGSFLTPYMAASFRLDNLLYIYLVLVLVGAGVVRAMAVRFPVLVFTASKGNPASKRRFEVIGEFKQMLPLIKSSTLFKIMLVLTFMPNVVIPIVNYQFNFAVDTQFASESGMIAFFGYFRGVLNIVSLFILLFVGRIYGRWGLPVALMFHPFNYALAMIAFLVRFDIFSAMYTRMSTNVIRTTINVPSNAILMGLFPDSYRAKVRPFLRGTVVRLALFLGSGLILLSTGLFHPRYLTLVALPFIVAWGAAPFLLKRSYSRIIMDLMASDRFEFQQFDEAELAQVLKGAGVRDTVVRAFDRAKGDDALWYAGLMKHMGLDNLDDLILEKAGSQDNDTCLALIGLLSPDPPSHVPVRLAKHLSPENPRVASGTLEYLLTCDRPHILRALGEKDLTPYLKHPDPNVQGSALACLSVLAPGEYEHQVKNRLSSKDETDQRTGVIAAGLAGDETLAPELMTLLFDQPGPRLTAELLEALSRLSVSDVNKMIAPYLGYEDDRIREAALKAMTIEDETTLRLAVQRMGDTVARIRDLARKQIQEAEYTNHLVVVESLAIPNTRLREGIFALLETLDIKDGDVYAFAGRGVDAAYRYLAMALHMDTLPPHPVRDLIKTHLMEKKQTSLENVIRGLAVRDETGQMKAAWKGFFSSDAKLKANAVELMSTLLDRRLFEKMRPLLESPTPEITLSEAKAFTPSIGFDGETEDLFSRLVLSNDWVDVVLGLDLSLEDPALMDTEAFWKAHDAFTAHHIIKEIEMIHNKRATDAKGGDRIADTELSLAEKIILLRDIDIFKDLTVAELAAIAAVTKELEYPENHEVIKQGNAGETVFMIISGRVDVIREQKDGTALVIDAISRGGAFGEMALLDDAPRSATIKTTESCRFLILHKQEFNETVMEYPRIALQICSELSSRIRHLHGKIDNSA